MTKRGAREVTRRTVLAGAAGALAVAGTGRPGAAGDGKQNALRTALGPYVEDGFVPGFVAAVWHEGDTVIEAAGEQAYDGAPMRPDSIFRIASITKPITAFAALMLVEEGRLALDEPVDDLLPELADRRVLRSIDAELDDTVPAKRAITLRDLLTLRFGLGAIMVWPPEHPIQKAMQAEGFAPGYKLPTVDADAYMARLGSLPLAAQPGEAFFYDTGMHVVGVLIARATEMALSAFLQERLFAPLGMTDTGFWVAPRDQDRLTALYLHNSEDGERVDLGQSELPFTAPPAFESGSGGLVSTVPDYLRFARLLLGRGEIDGKRLLSAEHCDLMATDQLTAEQRKSPNAVKILGPNSGWGLGIAVDHGGGELGLGAGSIGWHGGYGTSAYVDPSRQLIGVLMTPRVMASPEPSPTYVKFWRAAYEIGA
ncbi:MAG: serine hydrolase domain-containing protein [Dichotomicrobium sp.]